MTAISVSERLLEMAAFYTPLALTVTKGTFDRADFPRPFYASLRKHSFWVLLQK